MSLLLSRSEFARLAGVSPAAITKACRGPLSAASVGPRLDAAHPSAVEYLAQRDRVTSPEPRALSSAELDAIADRVAERLIARLGGRAQ